MVLSEVSQCILDVEEIGNSLSEYLVLVLRL